MKQPQIAVEKDTVAVTWGSANAVYASVSTDGGRRFKPAVKVGEAPMLMLGMHRGPRIAISDGALLVSAIQGTERMKDGDLVVYRSTDGGATWSKPAKLNDLPNAAREGLHGMAAQGRRVLVTWLDLRSGAMQLYGAVSEDGGQGWSENRLIYQSPDGFICQCCHPTAHIGAKGEIYAMWRNALAGSRDLWMAVSKDGGKTWSPAKLGKGTWPLNACPMDGGGLATDERGAVHTAWRREGTVYYAKPGEAETELGKGRNPALAATSKGAYVIWTDGPELKLKSPGSAEAVTIAPEAAFPVLAGSGPVFAAWEEKGGIAIRRLP